MSGNQPTRKVVNQLMPNGNVAKTLPYVAQTASGGPDVLDLTYALSNDVIDQIQAVFVDNWNGTTAFAMTIQSTGMVLRVPAGEQGWFPILVASPTGGLFTFTGAMHTTPVFFMNVPMPVGTWGGTGGGGSELITAVDSNFTVVSGTLQFAPIPSGEVIGNATTATAEPTATPLSNSFTINAGTIGIVPGSLPAIAAHSFLANATGGSAVPVALPYAGGFQINSGTVYAVGTNVSVGLSAGVNTIAVGLGTTHVNLAMPVAGGNVTLAYAGSGADQPFAMHITQGATAGTIVLNTGTTSGFEFGAVGGPTSYTITATPGDIDDLFCLGINTGFARIEAINQGFAN
jgi:hypothetical protein